MKSTNQLASHYAAAPALCYFSHAGTNIFLSPPYSPRSQSMFLTYCDIQILHTVDIQQADLQHLRNSELSSFSLTDICSTFQRQPHIHSRPYTKFILSAYILLLYLLSPIPESGILPTWHKQSDVFSNILIK